MHDDGDQKAFDFEKDEKAYMNAVIQRWWRRKQPICGVKLCTEYAMDLFGSP